MRRGNRELWYSLVAIVLSTAVYGAMLAWFKEIPAASDFYGHLIGILGFLLMLATETLYSLRKRSRRARWGRMSAWLEFHIFTGLVGPYLVLLHSSWKFNGVAGVAMLLTGVIVISGFIGRYIYTAVPRGLDGVEVEASALQEQIRQASRALASWLQGQPEAIQAMARGMEQSTAANSVGMGLLFARGWVDMKTRLRWRRLRKQLVPTGRAQARQLEMLLQRRTALQRQLGMLATARQLLGVWRTLHIPVGISLFVAALVHAVAAVYYATLLR